MTEKTEKSRVDSGTVTKGLDPNDKNSIVNWFKKSDDAVQQLMVDGEMVTVKFKEIEKQYEVFSIKGAYSKIGVDHFESQPLKVEEMGEGINKDGTPKKVGDEADLYMTAWCVNKITALKEDKISRENFWKMKKFIHTIVFGGDEKGRKSPPAGIKKELITAKKFEWESHKYKVSMSKDGYRKLELKVQTRLQKFLKTNEPDHMRKAETELVKILQKSMKLKPGMYSSSQGFSNYFTEMFSAMFPKQFGTDVRIKKLKEDGEW